MFAITDSQCDVLVVGGGPAGSTSAVLLARQGYSVQLVDLAHFPRNKPCGEYMSPGVVRLLSEMDILGALREHPPRPVEGMEIVGPAGETMHVRYPSDAGWLSGITCPRVDLDAQLLAEAQRQGVDIRQGARATHLLRNDGAVVGAAGMQGGRPWSTRARLTVVADGARSTLSTDAGVSVLPRWPSRLGLVAHYREDGSTLLPHGRMHVWAGGYCGIAPLPAGQLNVAMVVRVDAVKRYAGTATDFFEQTLLDHRLLHEDLLHSRRTSRVYGIGPIGSRARRASLAGCMLVGDAAGFFDPFTGEGVYRALRGAQLLAAVAGPALRAADVSAKRLQAYDRLRVQEFRQKAQVASLVQLFVQYPALMRYALPRLAARPLPYETLSAVLGDIRPAGHFLRPKVLWAALRP